MRALAQWLHTLDPTLQHYLEAQGIAPEIVEAKYWEECCTSLAYRHRLTRNKVFSSSPRFRIRIDAKC